MDDFIKELVKDFLEEAFSLVDNLEYSLLELEKDVTSEKAIDEIFRAAHTVKGGAGTVGFDELQRFTHIMEDVFDLVRKDKLLITIEDISMLLQCKDQLENMLMAREKGEIFQSPKIDALLEALGKLKTKGSSETTTTNVTSEPAKKTVPTKIKIRLTNYELSTVNHLLLEGKKTYILRYKLKEHYEMREVSAFQLHALLKDIAEIIKTVPSIEELENSFSPMVVFVLATDKSVDFIKSKTMLSEMIESINVSEVNSQKIQELESSIAIKSEKDHFSKTKSNETEDLMEKRALSTLRVESWKVDNLMNQLGELVITKSTLSQLDLEFDKHSSNIKTVLKEFITGIAKLDLPGDVEIVAEKNKLLLDSLTELFASFETYSESMQKLNRVASSLQENVMNMRMVPIQMVFSRFPRLMRDIASKLGKKIELVIEGVETEIDKGMVDDIFDPLIHILRNAVDHGIELPEVRKNAGKSKTGKIVLKAIHEGDSIVIEVSDDGKGMDTDVIVKKAIQTKLFTAEALRAMSERELLSIIFLPGFSTAKEVSNLSGRGVGMDVVKRKIEEIGGSVGIATIKNKGTRIVIRLPLTLAIIQGLLIVVEEMHYVIPVASVEETMILNLNDLKEINGRLTIELRGKLIPILPLKTFFYDIEMKKGDRNKKEYGIVTKYGERVVCIIVNEVIGEQDIVIKPLNTKLIKSPGISAATIVGDSGIGYIIDTSQVISHYFKSMK